MLLLAPHPKTLDSGLRFGLDFGLPDAQFDDDHFQETTDRRYPEEVGHASSNVTNVSRAPI